MTTYEEVEEARRDPKHANIVYHDWEAETYNEKWSISFDQRCMDYALGRFELAVGGPAGHYGTALELGSGPGFFLLNLMQAGVASRGIVTDISPNMVDVATRNGRELGLDVQGRVADAETIPCDDNSVDLVVGHAVLHHIPDVRKALSEVLRVLRPGGRFVFAGEPTTIGDFYARRLGALTWWLTTNVTRLPGLRDWRRPQEELDESSAAAALEAVVDLHTFMPSELARLAQRIGAIEVSAPTEELTAAFLGWPVRTFEAAVSPDKLGMRWATFAGGAWQALSKVDSALYKVLPRDIFYNTLLTGRKCGD